MAALASGLSAGRSISRRSWPTPSLQTLLYPLSRTGVRDPITRHKASPLHQLSNRHFTSRPQANARSDPSARQHADPTLALRIRLSYRWASELVGHLKENNFEKCGFVVYRRDYSNDSIWKQYEDYINRGMRDAMRELPGLNCEVTFVEDRENLEGAKNYKLRQIHKNWAESAIIKENPRWEPPERKSWWYNNPRYDYFVTLDARSLWVDQIEHPQDDQRSFNLNATDWYREKDLEMLNFNSWDVMDRRHRGWVKLRMEWFQVFLYEELWGREPGDALQRIKWKRDRNDDMIRHLHSAKWTYHGAE